MQIQKQMQKQIKEVQSNKNQPMQQKYKMRKLFFLILLGVCLQMSGCTCARKLFHMNGDSKKGVDPLKDTAPPDYTGITVERVLKTDVNVGKGTESVHDGDTVFGKYTLWVYDPKKIGNKGKKVGESGDKVTKVNLGKEEVIKGWEQGILGMKVGGKRSVIIPISLAYGKEGAGEIPPNSILLLEFELTELKSSAAPAK